MTLFDKGAYLWTAGFGWCLVLYCCNSCRVCIGTVRTWDSYIFRKCRLFDEYKTRQISFAIKLHIDNKGLGALFKDTTLLHSDLQSTTEEHPLRYTMKHTHPLQTHLVLLLDTSLSKCYCNEKHLRQELAPTRPWKSYSTALNNDVFSLQAPVLGHCHKPPQLACLTYLTNSTPVLNQTFEQ